MIMSARKILLSVILIFTFLSVVAQNKCTVSGLVSDKNGEPVYCASVVLYDGNKVIAGGITNERGGFNLIFPRSAKSLSCEKSSTAFAVFCSLPIIFR